MITIARPKSLRSSKDIQQIPLMAMFAEEPTTDIINVQEDALKQNQENLLFAKNLRQIDLLVEQVIIKAYIFTIIFNYTR